MLLGLLVATYRKASRDLLRNFEMGRFRLGFLAALIVYNWTKAGFKTTGFVFFAFYLIAIDYVKPTLQVGAIDSPPDRDESSRRHRLQVPIRYGASTPKPVG
jgi:hypothetical protein